MLNDAQKLVALFKQGGLQAAQVAFDEIVTSKNLKKWEANALAQQFYKLAGI
jgi:hypothetical protein